MNAAKKFYKMKKFAIKKQYKEIDSLVWVHENRFRKILSYNANGQMWERVRNFLKESTSFTFFQAIKSTAHENIRKMDNSFHV